MNKYASSELCCLEADPPASRRAVRRLCGRLFRLATSHLEDVSCHRSQNRGYLSKHEVRAWRHRVELRHRRLLVSRVHRHLPTRTSRLCRLSGAWLTSRRSSVKRTEQKVRSSLEALCWCTASPVKSSSPQSCWTTWQDRRRRLRAQHAAQVCTPPVQLEEVVAALREAFGDTQKRLMELEDERQCFLDEGVYDVVNSICGQTGLSPKAGLTGLMGDADNHTTKTNGDAGAITFHIGSVDPSADLLALAGSPVAPPPSADLLALAGSPAALPLSPLSLAQMVAKRSEQDLRSAELSGENDKLRRELERTTKILEVLEQQRHLAEDKMLALEQEHAVLVRRLAEMEGGARSELSPDSFEVGTVKPSSLFYVM
ncbi:unnamed protein product [Symbiodinium microadriaticum]|nr:unnamed protein product [Symbiodinium microadriaticum]